MKTVLTAALILAAGVSQAQYSPSDLGFFRALAAPYTVKGGFISPHWMADGNSFWWIQDGEAISIDPASGKRTRLVDAARLRAALKEALKHDIPGAGLPINDFTLDEQNRSIYFEYDDHYCRLDLRTYGLRTDLPEPVHNEPRLLRKSTLALLPAVYEKPSPGGKWMLGSVDGNLYVREPWSDDKRFLTRGGTKDDGWDPEPAEWAPDGRTVLAVKWDQRKVPKYPIMHFLKSPEEVEWVRLLRVGFPDISSQAELIDVSTGKATKIPHSQSLEFRGWDPNGDLVSIRRDAKRLEFVLVDPKTGAGRSVFSETTKTFFDLALSLPNSPNYAPVDKSRFLWLSERDGWNQIYLYSYQGGAPRQLTVDHRPVLRIVTVDGAAGWVYYTAYGGGGHPYDLELYRVSLNGGPSQQLTEAHGQHDGSLYFGLLGAGASEGILFSPSKQYFLDAHSDVNRPPETDLRRADGTLVAEIAKADGAPLEAVRTAPREFTAKAADGQTDLCGVMYLPKDFDPAKKYPVVDSIYAGPQTPWVSHTFAGIDVGLDQAVANSGFVVVCVDARGTPNRGKAFQDVVYMNFGRNEIPDHVAAIRQVAAQNRFLDLDRVGVFGGSFGGYFTIRAMLQAPDFYKVGVALSPASELRDITPGMADYLGDPATHKAEYDYASDVLMAANLKGRLLLIHGTSDVNAPFSGTIQLIDALVKAGKPYDLILLPEQDHVPRGASQTYYLLAMKRYFEEHLK